MVDPPAPPRIALVGPTHPAPGGIAHFTAGLADALAAHGESLIVGWTRRFPERLYPGTIDDTVSATSVSAAGEPLLDLLDPRSWRRAARRIRRFRPDVLVLQWWHPIHAPVVIALARSCRRHGIRVVMICHNVEPHESNALWRGLTRRALRQVDALIVHSPTLVPSAERAAPGVPVISGFLPIFQNVADATGTASPEAIAAVMTRTRSAGRPLLLCFGYVRPYKGVEDAIAAMSHVTTDCTLLVAGECWDNPDQFLDLRERFGVADRVTLDFRYIPNDELPALFAAAAAVVVPYRSATQSGVAALAFAYGRPVVATRTGGLADLVEDGITGALSPPRDPPALAAAIDRVLADGRNWTPAIHAVTEKLTYARYLDLIDDASSAPRQVRDDATHAMLEPGGRRDKAAKIIAVLNADGPLTGARLLDIGTGSGTIATELAHATGPDGTVTSVDVDDVRVDRSGYAFVPFDGQTLPFPDGSFDVVVSNHVIEHVGDRAAQQRHVAEIVRVLCSGGRVYVAVPHRWQLVENHYRLPLLGWVRGALADRYLQAMRRGQRYDCRPLGRHELLGLLRGAGLDAHEATADLIHATRTSDAGIVGRLLRSVPGSDRLVRGPALPSIAALGRRR